MPYRRKSRRNEMIRGATRATITASRTASPNPLDVSGAGVGGASGTESRSGRAITALLTNGPLRANGADYDPAPEYWGHRKLGSESRKKLGSESRNTAMRKKLGSESRSATGSRSRCENVAHCWVTWRFRFIRGVSLIPPVQRCCNAWVHFANGTQCRAAAGALLHVRPN